MLTAEGFGRRGQTDYGVVQLATKTFRLPVSNNSAQTGHSSAKFDDMRIRTC